MKIWRRRRKPKEVRAHIAQLERELGIDDATLLAPLVIAPPKKRELFKPPILDRNRILANKAIEAKYGFPASASLNFTQITNPEDLRFKPGAIIALPPGADFRMLH